MSEKGSISQSFLSRDRFSYFLMQYGNVFTFVLLGRRVTVALGVKGNNFILGGKSTVFNAEDAYKVHSLPYAGRRNFESFLCFLLFSSISPHLFSARTSSTMLLTTYSWSRKSLLKLVFLWKICDSMLA